ncbi:M3 family metallopeptidase [Sphingomonas sp. JC676]|uniref:M3 family metallopeptidase n=1 Tax=Sphingomonas sp. JC676 TaxID=2768065 RepID=UPI00223C103D|nr:M3 family metallopeptidase [Sphingomonas sp. JC676]
MADAIDADPLLDESELPFAAPDFRRIETERFLPAFQTAIDEAAREIAAISDNPAAPSFDNSIVALERAGARLARVRRIFWALSSARSDEAMRSIEPDISALLTRHGTAISHNRRLFERVRAVWEGRETMGLDQAQLRLVEDSHRGFINGGALLDGVGKVRFAEIDQALSALSTRFGQNVLAAAQDWEMYLEPADLDGLPDPMRDASARRAEARGHPGRHLLTLDRGDAEGLLTFSRRRDLRERMWHAFTTRCDGGAHDNRAIVDEILALRHERAVLLGHACYADYALADSMAKIPEAASELLMRVWSPALRQAASEQRELQRLADADNIVLAPWDWRYYSEQIRRDRYALDGGEVKRYLTLDTVREAAFATANSLYGIALVPNSDLPVWHQDVTAWTVSDAGGSPLGLLYTDYLARSGKHGGAWMGSLRVQEKLDGRVLPIAYLVANFAKASPNAETGLSIDEARTLFHEFGHALHALLSDVVYPSQAGTAVARDFVEFPSKFLEHWIVSPETLDRLGVPPALTAAIGRADDFGQGFMTIEFLASAILDLELHRSVELNPRSSELAAATLAAITMPPLIVPRHGLTHFTHVFDGGYASAYYSYLWSEVLDADAFAAFTESGNIFDPALAARFRIEVLARGNSRDPMASFVAFRGRTPDEAALLRERAFQ